MSDAKPPPDLMTPAKGGALSRREREIMDVVFRLGRATAAQIQAGMDDPPSYTAVRTQLTILEKKGHVRHQADGVRYVYEPIAERGAAGRTAARTLLKTFYDNSVERAVAAMLAEEDIAPEELDRLAALIDQARKDGR